MQTERMRRLLQARGLAGVAGVLLASAFLLLHFVRQRPRRAAMAAFIVVALLGGGAALLHGPATVAPAASDPPPVPEYLVTNLGTLSNHSDSAALAINNKGEIVGWSGVPLKATRAFCGGTARCKTWGTLQGGSRSGATAINDAGQVAGWSGNDEYTHSRAFLWQKGRMRDLGTLPGRTFSTATSINRRGEVVGAAFNSSEAPARTSGPLFGGTAAWLTGHAARR
jgi:probable HAF family extracellular repeat protein